MVWRSFLAAPTSFPSARVQHRTFRYHISQYLSRRAEDWRAAGFDETLADWAALNARSKFWGDDQRAAFLNWEELTDPRNPLDGRQGVNERIMLRELLRRVDMMVILENNLDALVRLHTPWPPGIIGGPHQYDIPHNITAESLYGPNAGLTEVLIPAGYGPWSRRRPCQHARESPSCLSRVSHSSVPKTGQNRRTSRPHLALRGTTWHYVAQGAPYMYARIQPGPAPVARTQSRCSAKNASVRSLASFALSAS